MRGELLCDEWQGFAISNRSDCAEPFSPRHVCTSEGCSSKYDGTYAWTMHDILTSGRHEWIKHPEGPWKDADTREDIVIFRNLRISLQGDYYVCFKNPGSGWSTIPQSVFHVYDAGLLTYEVLHAAPSSDIDRKEFCNHDDDPLEDKQDKFSVKIRGVAVNPFNPSDRFDHRFALSTVPDCSGSCSSEDLIMQNLGVSGTTTTIDGSQLWRRIKMDTRFNQQDRIDLGLTDTTEGCYQSALRAWYTYKLCELTWRNGTCTAYTRCVPNPMSAQVGPVAQYFSLKSREEAVGFTTTLTAAIGTGRYYVCYKSCNQWNPLAHRNNSFIYKPYFDVVGVKSFSANPVADAQNNGEDFLFYNSPFEVNFRGVGLSINDTVAFVKVQSWFTKNTTCKVINSFIRSDREKYVTELKVNVTSEYFHSMVNNVVLDVGDYIVCYRIQRHCFNKMNRTLKVRPQFVTCPTEGWTPGSSINFEVHLPPDSPVSFHDRVHITKAECNWLTTSPTNTYWNYAFGVRVDDVNRTTNVAFVRSFKVPYENAMGPVLETLNICYLSQATNNAWGYKYDWKPRGTCTIRNKIRYTDRDGSVKILGTAPFPIGTAHIPAKFDTGVLKGLNISLVEYADPGTTCVTAMQSKWQNIHIIDETNMQRFTRFDLAHKHLWKTGFYLLCLSRGIVQRNLTCCDPSNLPAVIYDTNQTVRVMGKFHCICSRTILAYTNHTFRSIDPEGITLKNLNTYGSSSFSNNSYVHHVVGLDINAGDCSNPTFQNINIYQNYTTKDYYFRTPYYTARNILDGRSSAGHQYAVVEGTTFPYAASYQGAYSGTNFWFPGWYPGNYSICMSGGVERDGKRTYVKQGHCTLLVVGFNDTECRSFIYNRRQPTKVTLKEYVGISTVDRIGLTTRWNPYDFSCSNLTISNVTLNIDSPNSAPYFYLPTSFPVGRYRVCLSLNNGPYTVQSTIEVLPNVTKAINRDWFLHGDNTTKMIFGIECQNYTITHIGLDNMNRPNQDQYPLCCSGPTLMAASAIPVKKRTLVWDNYLNPKKTFAIRDPVLVTAGGKGVDIDTVIVGYTPYRPGMRGTIVSGPLPSGFWVVDFGVQAGRLEVDPKHMTPFIVTRQCRYDVQFDVPTLLAPGNYTICLRGKDNYNNSYVKTHLKVDIYGFTGLVNNNTKCNMSIRSQPGKVYIQGRNHQLKRVGLVYKDDLDVDFRHSDYDDWRENSWNYREGRLHETYRGRELRPWSYWLERFIAKCNQNDRRYEFPVEYEGEQAYFNIYNKNGIDLTAGSYFLCAQFDEVQVAKNATDWLKQPITSRYKNIGWHFMPIPEYSILEKFNVIENLLHPRKTATHQTNVTSLYSEGYIPFGLSWVEPRKLNVGDAAPTPDQIASVSNYEYWERSLLRVFEKFKLVQCPDGSCDPSYCSAHPVGADVHYLGTACSGVNTFAINATVKPGRYQLCISKRNFQCWLPTLTPVIIDVVGFTAVDRPAEWRDADTFINIYGSYGLTGAANQGIVLCYNWYGRYTDPASSKFWTSGSNLEAHTESFASRNKWSDARITPDCHPDIIRPVKTADGNWAFKWPTNLTKAQYVYVFFSINVGESKDEVFGTLAHQNAVRVDSIGYSPNQYYYPAWASGSWTVSGLRWFSPSHRMCLVSYKNLRETMHMGIRIYVMLRPTCVKYNRTISGRRVCHNRICAGNETLMHTYYKIGLGTQVFSNGLCSNTLYSRDNLPIAQRINPSYGTLPEYYNIPFGEDEYFGTSEERYAVDLGARYFEYGFTLPYMQPGTYNFCLAHVNAPWLYRATGIRIAVSGWEGVLADNHFSAPIKEVIIVEGELRNVTLINAHNVDGMVIGLTRGICDAGIPELNTSAISTDPVSGVSTWKWRAPSGSAGTYKVCISLEPWRPSSWVEQEAFLITILRPAQEANCLATPICGYEFDAQRGQVYRCKPPPNATQAPLTAPAPESPNTYPKLV